MSESLWTQKQAAAFLAVSTRYLRESNCPKVFLPSAKAGGKPLLRYDPVRVRQWAAPNSGEAA